jgi:hypothetical protein
MRRQMIRSVCLASTVLALTAVFVQARSLGLVSSAVGIHARINIGEFDRVSGEALADQYLSNATMLSRIGLGCAIAASVCFVTWRLGIRSEDRRAGFFLRSYQTTMMALLIIYVLFVCIIV